MVKKIIVIAIVLVLGSQSVYFRTLSEMDNTDKSFVVDAATVENMYTEGVLNNTLISPWDQLMSDVNSATEITFSEKGNRMGIGVSAYFLVSGTAVITSIEDGQLTLDNGSSIDAKYIFGNELRDASRYLSLEDFSSQGDLNTLTESFNAYVRSKIDASAFKAGDQIYFVGATRIDRRTLPVKSFMIIPAKIEIQ